MFLLVQTSNFNNKRNNIFAFDSWTLELLLILNAEDFQALGKKFLWILIKV